MTESLSYKQFITRLNKSFKGLGARLDERVKFCKENNVEFSLGKDLVYYFKQKYELIKMNRISDCKTVGYYYDMIGTSDKQGEFWCAVRLLTETKERRFSTPEELYQ